MDVMIVGAGFIGRLHKLAWERNGARVAAIVDPHLNEEARRAYQLEGTEVVGSIADACRLFPAISAASVCTPPKFHAAALMELLERDLPVLMEKPVSARREDYEAMLEQTEKRKGRVMVGLTQRFYPEVRRTAEWISQGRIGRPLALHDTLVLSGEGLPAWYYDLDISGGGILITNGSHLLDRVQYLLDDDLQPPDHYDGVLDAGGFDRLAYVSGKLGGGVPYRLYLEWSNVSPRQETIVFGTEGRIELQVWGLAKLFAKDGAVEEFRAYGNEDSFEDKTLIGLSSEVRAFIDGLGPGAAFPKGLTLREHEVTMRAIWEGYRRLGRHMG